MSVIVRGLHWLEDALLVSSLVSMLFLALLQIVLRNFFDQGFLWAESFLRILVLWVAMLGAMVATRDNNHISIDVLARYLPAHLMRFVTALTCFVSAAVCGAVAWYAIEVIQYEYEDQTIAFASVPVWICQAIIPVGLLVMALRFIAYAIREFLVSDTHIPADTH